MKLSDSFDDSKLIGESFAVSTSWTRSSLALWFWRSLLKLYALVLTGPSQASDRPTAGATVRSKMATRLTTCTVRLLRTFPPLILLPGQSPNHEQNALALRQRLMSTPSSEIRIRTANTFNPMTLVKSTPQIRVSLKTAIHPQRNADKRRCRTTWRKRGIYPTGESCQISSAVFIRVYLRLSEFRSFTIVVLRIRAILEINFRLADRQNFPCTFGTSVVEQECCESRSFIPIRRTPCSMNCAWRWMLRPTNVRTSDLTLFVRC